MAPTTARNTPRLQGQRCHLMGIGGCGMSGLARLLRRRGCQVTGSDLQPSPVTDALVAEGFAVHFEQRAETLPDDVEVVVASAAIKPDNPELLCAVDRGVPVLSYAEALGLCMADRTGVAVAGTHGKSTTCAMLGWALAQAGLDPTVIVGAACRQLAEDQQRSSDAPVGVRMGAERIPAGPLQGRPGLLVAEACEYNRSFHHLRPRVASISAVEADHLDVYGSLDAVVEAFAQFVKQLPSAAEGGLLLIAAEGAHRREVTAGARCAVKTVGFAPQADWRVEHELTSGRTGLFQRGRRIAQWRLATPGEHNALNSAFAAALAVSLGAEPGSVAEALERFEGVERRTQLLGERTLPGGGRVRVYDDYGHHPTEIEATLRALRLREAPERRGGRLICVFQPHQHSRTRFLLDEFAASFSHADVVIVPQIYFVRDSEIEKTRVQAADLVDRLRSRGVRAMHLHPFEAIVEQLEQLCSDGDLLVVMGAGPVWKVAHAFMGLESACATQQATAAAG